MHKVDVGQLHTTLLLAYYPIAGRQSVSTRCKSATKTAYSVQQCSWYTRILTHGLVLRLIHASMLMVCMSGATIIHDGIDAATAGWFKASMNCSLWDCQASRKAGSHVELA